MLTYSCSADCNLKAYSNFDFFFIHFYIELHEPEYVYVNIHKISQTSTE